MFSILKPDFGRYRTDLLMDAFPLAIDASGETTWFPQRIPHVFIDGPLGSGKTITAQNLVIAATRAGWDAHVLRQFSREYCEFDNWPGVRIASTPPEHSALLSDTTAALASDGAIVRPVLVVIDTNSLLADIGNGGLDHLVNIVDRGGWRRINLVIVSDPTRPDVVPAVTTRLHRVELTRPSRGSDVSREITQWRPSDRSSTR